MADKVLYLDGDLLVRDDISSLWKTNISEYYSGAVIAPLMNSTIHGRVDHRIKLGMTPGATYFNAGVLLLNLKKCRKNNVMNKALKFIIENPELISFLEQDGLNVAMSNNCFFLHPRWNVSDTRVVDVIQRSSAASFIGMSMK